MNFQMFKPDLEKAEEQDIKLPTFTGSLKRHEFQKRHLLLLYWPFQSFWLCGSQHTVENSERDGNTRPPDMPPEKSVCRSGNNSYYWTWNNRLVPNQERSMSRLYIVTLLIYLICRVHHEKLDWMKHKLESRLVGKISISQICRRHHP